MDIRSVMAAREVIIQRNAALRDAAQSGRAPAPVDTDQFSKALVKAQALRSDATSTAEGAMSAQDYPPANFGSTLSNLLSRVNTFQEQEDVATEALEKGERTDFASVALEQQRASVTFEATLQIRNKLLSAYQDIMNIQL